jgi:short-subunit dehydrogenase
MRGAKFFLIDRKEELLKAVAIDLTVRGAKHVEAVTADLTEYAQHAVMLERAQHVLGGINLILVAHGTLPEQNKCEESWAAAQQALAINQLSAMSFLLASARVLRATPSRSPLEMGKATLAMISSVSGDRGRQSNFIYGTAKGALAIFASGLRNSLAKKNIHVLTIKPGFVDTPMTANFKKGLLWVSPAYVARDIVRAIDKKKNVIYTPSFWRLIMLVIRNIPEPIFKRMRL